MMAALVVAVSCVPPKADIPRACHDVKFLYLDDDFSPAERKSLQDAANDWNVALNGFECLETTSLHIRGSVHVHRTTSSDPTKPLSTAIAWTLPLGREIWFALDFTQPDVL